MVNYKWNNSGPKSLHQNYRILLLVPQWHVLLMINLQIPQNNFRPKKMAKNKLWNRDFEKTLLQIKFLKYFLVSKNKVFVMFDTLNPWSLSYYFCFLLSILKPITNSTTLKKNRYWLFTLEAIKMFNYSHLMLMLSYKKTVCH